MDDQERPDRATAKKERKIRCTTRARDATDTVARGSPCYGCHVVGLYNAIRPHGSLGNLTPREYAERSQVNQPRTVAEV